jgi:hypothetical protein
MDAIDYDELRREVCSLVQFAEKKYFNNISWTLQSKPHEATMYEHDDFRPITDREWNEVHHIDSAMAYLIVPLTRFEDVTEVLPLGKTLSIKNVITKLYEFYNTPLTQEKIDEVKEYPNDCFDYVDEVIDMSSKGKTVNYLDLRGDSIYFEGIKRVCGNVYKLNLGS